MPWNPSMLTPKPSGHVFVHREVAAQRMGRALTSKETVHHIDEVRTNNDPANLMVFRTMADHNRFHRGGTLVDHGDGTWSSVHPRTETPCPDCGGLKAKGATRCKPCHLSWLMAHKALNRRDALGRPVGVPDRQRLAELVERMPVREIAKLYGVTDVAVAHWCIKFGVQKKPRGFWLRSENTWVGS